MPFEQYFTIPTVVELKSDDKVEALKELAIAFCKATDSKKQKVMIDAILDREESSSTFIGQGLALPQARGPIKDDFAIIIGRSVTGIKYDAARNALAHVIVLLITNEDTDPNRQIQMLSEVASFFKIDTVLEEILSFEGPVDIRNIITTLKKGTPEEKGSKTSLRAKNVSPIIASAINLARDVKASAIMIFADTVRENDFLEQLKPKPRIIIVTSNKTRFDLIKDKRIAGLLQAPLIPASRTGQIKIGILLALSRNLIGREDTVVCISGNSRNGIFDTIVTIDVALEYDFFFTSAQNIVPPDVEPEVIERVIGLAGEIAVEGREGKPVGTIFVLGDTNSVNAYIRQLIINPFRGYSEAERNILDPGLVETIKEFASIDGAFVITGDGIVISAGSYLRPQIPDDLPPLPGGFGARHVAAAGITACTNALAITISESTGTVTLFKSGIIMMSIARPVIREKGQIQKYL
jgi:DNA integrity scanning protein DisA with diadenylate cyclase activity/mannitol/fructose-specific phosphotransferase system IIA component (Ntr-type)